MKKLFLSLLMLSLSYSSYIGVVENGDVTLKVNEKTITLKSKEHITLKSSDVINDVHGDGEIHIKNTDVIIDEFADLPFKVSTLKPISTSKDLFDNGAWILSYNTDTNYNAISVRGENKIPVILNIKNDKTHQKIDMTKMVHKFDNNVDVYLYHNNRMIDKLSFNNNKIIIDLSKYKKVDKIEVKNKSNIKLFIIYVK